ncbi:hypothetical protein ACFE04_028647 [Oxalis oulophora]
MELEDSVKEDAPMVFLDRTSRATRGKRMNKLLDEEIEEDDVFWNQDALKDEEEDNNYEQEQEAADVFDSDFDQDETEPEDAAENDGEERRTRKRLVYPGRPVIKKKKKKDLSELDYKVDGEEDSVKEYNDVDHHDDGEGEKTVRKSTRTAVVVRQAERDAIRAAIQATSKPIKRKKEGEEKKMTQEEMLLEAARTEIMNLRNLERVLAREEEIKKKAIVNKAVYSGPQIRYLSKNGCSFLEFSKGASFESEFATGSGTYPDKAVCAVTGLPAKYRDPKTSLPYATKEAFKIIRERYSDESGRVRKDMDMGNLFDSLSGTDFVSKRKRSHTSNTTAKVSDLRSLSRFRRIPALDEFEVSD